MLAIKTADLCNFGGHVQSLTVLSPVHMGSVVCCCLQVGQEKVAGG
jgi:hypothetical protein